jgi:uncharacterized protein GlcG (DUF336 family)
MPRTLTLILLAAASLLAQGNSQGQNNNNAANCRDLPSHTIFKVALTAVTQGGQNSGLGFPMWGTLVNRDGEICAIAFTGVDRNAQWPGSRIISAQKAHTANAFSLPGFALSTANLYFPTQPGGTLFELTQSNPVDAATAYAGNAANFGQANDPLTGKKIGGVNVFGGGLALYKQNGELVGAVGVSGDTSCADHIIAWKVRDRLGLDAVPAGPAGALGKDNIIFDLSRTANGELLSPSGFGHSSCGSGPAATAAALPTEFPTTIPNP